MLALQPPTPQFWNLPYAVCAVQQQLHIIIDSCGTQINQPGSVWEIHLYNSQILFGIEDRLYIA